MCPHTLPPRAGTAAGARRQGFRRCGRHSPAPGSAGRGHPRLCNRQWVAPRCARGGGGGGACGGMKAAPCPASTQAWLAFAAGADSRLLLCAPPLLCVSCCGTRPDTGLKLQDWSSCGVTLPLRLQHCKQAGSAKGHALHTRRQRNRRIRITDAPRHNGAWQMSQ